MFSPDVAPFVALAVLAAMVALFARERQPPEVIAIGATGLLLATGILDARDVMAQFSNAAPVTIACMLMLSGALVRVGALEAASGLIDRHARERPTAVILGMGVFVMAASAFMNNTPLVVMMIPIAVRLAEATQVSSAKLLIPLSYAAMLGGCVTLIGTSTNLLVDGVAREAGLAPFGLFEISGVGLIVAAVGLVYLVLAAPRLLPDRRALVDQLGQRKQLRFLSEVQVPEGSLFAGRRLAEIEPFKREGLTVVDVLRGDESLRRDLGAVVIEAGDRIVVRSRVNDLISLRQSRLLGVVNRVSERNTVTVEALAGPGCRLIGRSIGRMRLRRRYGVYPLAVHRRDQPIGAKLDEVVLRLGDTLLLEGDPEDIRKLCEDTDLVELQRPVERPYRPDRAPVVLAVLAGIVVLSALDVMPIAALTLIGVAIVLVSRCIDAEEAFASIDGRLLSLIVGMLAVGEALEKTGAVRMIVDACTPVLSAAPPMAVLYLLILLTCVLTEALSNNAVAVVMTPIAITLGQTLGIDPRPLVVGVMIAASASFATPVGYQTNMLVYAPGGYAFMDFVRIGAPLNLIVGIVATLAIPLFFPL